MLRYRFVPRTGGRRRREEAAQGQELLTAALRAAHGLGDGFSLCLWSGPAPWLELRTRSPSVGRWVARVLTVVYGPGAWSPAGPASAEPRLTPWNAQRLRASDAPSSTVAPLGAVVRACAAGFTTVGVGAVVEVALRPARSGADRWSQVLELALGSGSAREPPPVRRGSPTGPRGAPGAEGTHERPSWWFAELRLRTPAGREPPFVRALEAGWKALDGHGLRVRRPRRWTLLPCRFPIAEQELTTLFPSPEETLLHGPDPGVAGSGLPLGRDVTGGAVTVPVDLENGRHLAVLGETGMGKSSLLVALARRAASLGTVVFLDPVGDTADALERELDTGGRSVRRIAPSAPRNRANVLLGPSDGRPEPAASLDRRLDAVVHALRRVRSGRYADSAFWGPRLEEMLGRSLRAAASLPGGTLEEALALLGRRNGSGRRTGSTEAPEAQELAERVHERPEDAEGARRLLYEVVRDGVLRAMLCAHAPDVAIGELLSPRSATVVSGEAALVGESTARYLLSVYLALVWSALLQRGSGTKTFLFLDEAQWFAHESLAEMLRLGRRCNAHVILATQSLSSLPADVAEAVRTNAADLVVFRGSPDDARELARSLPGISPEELAQLPRGAAAALIGKGESVRWVRTARLPRPLTDSWVGPRRRLARASLPAAVPDGSTVPLPTDGGNTGEPEATVLGGADPIVRAVLDRLRAGAPETADQRLLPLSREQLAREVGRPLSAEEWRSLGSRLGRAGAIRRATPGYGRGVWLVERALALQALGGAATAAGPLNRRPWGPEPKAAEGTTSGTPWEGTDGGLGTAERDRPEQQQPS